MGVEINEHRTVCAWHIFSFVLLSSKFQAFVLLQLLLLFPPSLLNKLVLAS